MRTKEEIVEQVISDQNYLTDLIIKKGIEQNKGRSTQEIDIAMFFIIDRLKTLFWVLEVEVEDNNVLKPLGYYN
ncbi:hypothetical protein RDV78_05080 [Bacillota bacterium LX-D]|nr:hypothetical protein [Bacillota bacterium LX-D]